MTEAEFVSNPPRSQSPKEGKPDSIKIFRRLSLHCTALQSCTGVLHTRTHEITRKAAEEDEGGGRGGEHSPFHCSIKAGLT